MALSVQPCRILGAFGLAFADAVVVLNTAGTQLMQWT